MNSNRKIDIIIPVYNVKDDILFRCLASIAIQNILEDLEITLVDDASTKQNYEKVIEPFTSFMNIKILRYEVNGGPGVARQYGIDHTTNAYISFIDADDSLNGPFAMETLRKGIEAENNKYKMCVASFDEIIDTDYVGTNNTPAIINYPNNMVWVFSKIYRRSFLNEYNVRFHPTSRANEDTGFNSICNMLLQEEGLINFIPDHVYIWLDNSNSITRSNNHRYAFGTSSRDSLYGYVENMIYAYNTVKKIKPNCTDFLAFVVYTITWIYEHYIQCYAIEPQSFEGNMASYSRFYKEIYQYYEDQVTLEMIENFYEGTVEEYFEEVNIVPHKGFLEFIEDIKSR